MKFMYTKTPDKHCHDFGNGIFGRPMFSGNQRKALNAGWVFDMAKLEESPVLEVEADGNTEKEPHRDDVAKSLGISIYDENGEKLHYKLIDSAIKEAQENGEHNEG